MNGKSLFVSKKTSAFREISKKLIEAKYLAEKNTQPTST